jgi:hypothetical protein
MRLWLEQPTASDLVAFGESLSFVANASWHGDDGTSGEADVLWYRGRGDPSHVAIVFDEVYARRDYVCATEYRVRDIDGERYWWCVEIDEDDPRAERVRWWLEREPRDLWHRRLEHRERRRKRAGNDK